MLEKAVEGQLGSLAKYGEHQDAAVLFCKLHKYMYCGIVEYLRCTHPITITSTCPTFAVKKGDVYSAKVLKALENIDDECDENGIPFIKVVTIPPARMSSPLPHRLEKSPKQQVLALLTSRHLSILNQMCPISTQGI